MGLATRVPGPPGVPDNKTNNVEFVGKPRGWAWRWRTRVPGPPGQIRGKTSEMGLLTEVPGPINSRFIGFNF
ncbi:hypothetical protein NQ318_012720 [Aromia moschata]|uniref:Uncharacterized protein n=1 Tax=Aromia moschata TaxID=1265417 RepID=A0AAV8Y0E8_9CUCU|nr:hypothetical protein NQ318_012720 [Aromia moschata]